MNRQLFLGSGAAVAVGGALRPAFAMVGGEPIPAEALTPITQAVGNGLFERARAAFARHGARIMHHDVMAVVDFSAAS